MNDNLIRDWSAFSASCMGVNIRAELALQGQFSVGAAPKLSCTSFFSAERIKYHLSQNVIDRDVQIQAEPSIVFHLVPGQGLRSSVFQVNATPGRPESLLAVTPPKAVIWGRIKNLGFPVFLVSESNRLPPLVLSPVVIKIRTKLG